MCPEFLLVSTSRTKWLGPHDNKKLTKSCVVGRRAVKGPEKLKTQESGREEASNKVNPQSLNMSYDEVHQIAAKTSNLSVRE